MCPIDERSWWLVRSCSVTIKKKDNTPCALVFKNRASQKRTGGKIPVSSARKNLTRSQNAQNFAKNSVYSYEFELKVSSFSLEKLGVPYQISRKRFLVAQLSQRRRENQCLAVLLSHHQHQLRSLLPQQSSLEPFLQLLSRASGSHDQASALQAVSWRHGRTP